MSALITFIYFRLREIRNNTDIENWSYCPTEFNPLDLITPAEITKKLRINYGGKVQSFLNYGGKVQSF